MTREQKRKDFIHELTLFLVGNEGWKSVMLDARPTKDSTIKAEPPDLIREWQRLRLASPLIGWYPDVAIAEQELTEFLTKS